MKIGISRQSLRIDVNPLSQIRLTDQVLYGFITSSKFSIIDVSIYDNLSIPIISGEYVHSQTFQLDLPLPFAFVKNSFHPTSQVSALCPTCKSMLSYGHKLGNRFGIFTYQVKIKLAMMNAGTRGSGRSNLQYFLISKLKYTVIIRENGYIFGFRRYSRFCVPVIGINVRTPN